MAQCSLFRYTMSGQPSRKNSSHHHNNNDEESMLSVMASNNLEFVGERLILEATNVERLVDYWRAFDVRIPRATTRTDGPCFSSS
jgi:hypothetical protein